MKKILLALAILASLTLHLYAAGNYKVVLKTGKIIVGDFQWENENTICVVSDGLKMSFKKEKLDLPKMKELNEKSEQSQPEKSASEITQPKVPEEEGPSVVALAKEAQRSRTGQAKKVYSDRDKASSASDAEERETLIGKIAELEKEIAELEKTPGKLSRKYDYKDLEALKKMLDEWKKQLLKLEIAVTRDQLQQSQNDLAQCTRNPSCSVEQRGILDAKVQTLEGSLRKLVAAELAGQQ